MLERVEKRHIERKGLVPGPAERPRTDLPPGADLIEWRMDGEGRMGVSEAAGLASLGVGERLARLGTVVA